MEKPFAAYAGDEPYVFVCYSHEDSGVVYPEMAWLRTQGVNIWYDDGIEPGASWRDEVASALSQCSVMLLYVSPRSVNSQHCEQELNFALSRDLKVLCCHLAKTHLPIGMELALGNKQAILRAELSAEAYQSKLKVALRGLIPTSKLLQGLSAPQTRNNDVAVAILPLETRSGGSDGEYLGSGITDELIRGLSRVNGLRVISKLATLHDSRVDLGQLQNELGVENLLTGSVQKVGSRVRINAVLTRLTDGTTLWSERYDRDFDDIFELQDDVAHQVVNALEVKIGRPDQRLIDAGTNHAGAYNEYMLGLFESGNHSPRHQRIAIEHFKSAVRLDDQYAQAYSALQLNCLKLRYRGDAATDEVEQTIDEAAARLDVLDPRRALADRFYIDGLLRDIREPLNSIADQRYRDVHVASQVIRNRGDFHETYVDAAQFDLARRCGCAGLYRAMLELSPSELAHDVSQPLYEKAQAWAALGQFDRANRCLSEALQQSPSYVEALAQRAMNLARSGQYTAAEQDLTRLDAIFGERNLPRFCLQFWRGELDTAQATFEWLEPRRGFLPIYKGCAALMLGQINRGLDHLETELRNKTLWSHIRALIDVLVPSAIIDELKTNSRYQGILESVGGDDGRARELIEIVNELEPFTGVVVKPDEDY